ncbi:MAG TPA: NAD+ synthase [Gemmatimonas aurantiaca]|uniref:Glutamine-dependent NAD(+) synthetase n=3 Tax=Gemmatimonas aurantiaca TaxID=173480 RepID=C1AAM9_GEMAT|nr:NAD+ synthase [Gemmatimonas aurantiaca]BAH39827.1 NH(3)-dependent NAD (+) synthetase [Gemmatimonas aurantiaca T-27]HCT58162.1 NAD+ synthase [Gemmatimonas aurantiaca]
MLGDPIRPLTIALCQFAPRKGDTVGNLARIGRLCAQAASLEPRPQVVHFPETALSGYFVEGGVREVAVTAGVLAYDLDDAYRAACLTAGLDLVPLDVVIGFYERWRDTLHNSAAYITIGLDDGPPVLRHVHRKNFLPTYGLFDEERFVERGTDIRAFETPWGRAALLVCEDAWHSISGTLAALDGAQLVFVSSAAPARGSWPREDGIPGPYSAARWERLIRDIAEEHGVYTSFVNLVGSEGGKRFFGTSHLVGPGGDVRGRAPVWEESFVTFTVDLDDIVRARSDSPLLSDLRVALPHVLDNVRRVTDGAPTALAYDGPEPGAADLLRQARGFTTGEFPIPSDLLQKANTVVRALPEQLPVIRHSMRDHGGPPPLAIDAELTEEWLTGFLREEMARRGFGKAVVGISGGVDSAVTAALAVRALGASNVIGVRLPYRTSSAESLDHAQLVIDALGIESRTLDISPAVDGYLANEPDADGARRGNVMARVRMIALFDLSARYRALPLGTGNKTERLFGYFTWHADDSPPVNPIGDLYKTQVWELARHLELPSIVITKAPTADLIVGQTDESDLGISYPRADEILNGLLHGYSDEAMRARGFSEEELGIVSRRLNGTHWKRRPPATALVSQSGIGESYLRPVDY